MFNVDTFYFVRVTKFEYRILNYKKPIQIYFVYPYDNLGKNVSDL